MPSRKDGPEKSTVCSKENRNEEVFKNIIIQPQSLLVLRARYFLAAWGVKEERGLTLSGGFCVAKTNM